MKRRRPRGLGSPPAVHERELDRAVADFQDALRRAPSCDNALDAVVSASRIRSARASLGQSTRGSEANLAEARDYVKHVCGCRGRG